MNLVLITADFVVLCANLVVFRTLIVKISINIVNLCVVVKFRLK